MKYRYLGKSGLMVSRVCLGTMTFGNAEWGCDASEAREMTRVFLDAGGTFFDTADAYSGGVSEQMLGDALKGRPRDDVVIATKCFFRMGKTPNAKGLSRVHIISACEASLRRLGMDHVDLYQIHGPDPHTPIEETMRALEDLIRQGKVRYAGCSNLYAWQIVKANAAAERAAGSRFVSGQYLYNLVVRDVEREILPACESEGMGLICWSPLGSGMLTGKYRRAEKPEEGTRIQKAAVHELPRYWHERGFGIAEELVKTSRQLGVPPAHAALSWLLHDRRVSSVIVGARTPAQLKENLAAGDWDIPADAWKRLEEASRFEHGYPKQWQDIALPMTFTDSE
jgi:aryl-alcohol dehydrogenase-like predicted oxidoreductase